MSFILKALKKLEDEKATRAAAPVEISSAILTSGRSVSLRPRRRWGWVAVPLVLLACVGLAYLFLHKTKPRIAEQRGYQPPPATAAAPSPAAPPAPPADAEPDEPTEVPSLPASVAKEEPARDEAKRAVLAEKLASRRMKVRERRMERERVRESVPTPAEPVRHAVASSSAITVSGIAYQDNPADSMAVVNGAIVRTGMTVAGARVERIFVDRVRFRGEGGTFEVPLAR